MTVLLPILLFIILLLEKFGINLIGTQISIMDILKPLVLEEKLEVLTPFIDFDEIFFADIEDREDGHFNGEVYSYHFLKNLKGEILFNF